MPLGRLWNVLVLLLYRRSFFSYSSPSNHKRPGFWSFKNLRLVPSPYLPPSGPAQPAAQPSWGSEKISGITFFFSYHHGRENLTSKLCCWVVIFFPRKWQGSSQSKPKQAKLKWYFVTKIVVIYCEKKMFKWSRIIFEISWLFALNLQNFWDH